MSTALQHESIPSGHALFCDDIRQEIDDQFSIIGVYPGRILAGANQAVIPKLGVVVYLQFPSGWDGETEYRIRVVWRPNDTQESTSVLIETPLRSSETNGTEKDGKTFIVHVIQMIISPLKTKTGGAVQVTAQIGSDELRLGTIEVIKEIRALSREST